MKIGKFTLRNRRWYYNDRQLANPILIVWKCIWFIPVIISLTIFAAIVAIFNCDGEDFVRIWTETL